MVLDELGLKYDTDKASHGHGYCDIYEQWLTGFNPRIVLEIGVFKGGSLRMWRDFFPEASIVGIDIDPSRLFSEDRINTFLCNQHEPLELDKLLEQGIPDLVIDDGSHNWGDQMISFFHIFPKMSPGSIYIIEDLHSSKHYAYDDGIVSPLFILEHLDIFGMIKDYKTFFKVEGNQGLGSYTIMLVRK